MNGYQATVSSNLPIPTYAAIHAWAEYRSGYDLLVTKKVGEAQLHVCVTARLITTDPFVNRLTRLQAG